MTSDARPPLRFLAGLPEDLRDQVRRLARPKELLPGAVLFSEGAVHPHIYLMEAGRVRLDMWVPHRGRMLLMTVGPGELLGWSPLFDEHPMTATAVALEPTRVLGINGADLRQLCESNPAAGCHIMRQIALAVSERLVATRLQMLDLFAAQQGKFLEEKRG